MRSTAALGGWATVLVLTAWAAQPFASLITQATADGAGGWILIGSQTFDDQIDHMTVRSLDAAGASTLLGCSSGSLSNSFVDGSGAIAPDAVYLVARNLSTKTTEIDRIAR